MTSSLDIVVFESDPTRSAPITPAMFSDLVDMSSESVPIPVVPTALLSSDFSIITYPPIVKRTALWADKYGIRFKRAYGASSIRLLTLLPDDQTWMSWGRFLSPVEMGWWMLWGLNWLVIDAKLLMEFMQLDPAVMSMVLLADRESFYRSTVTTKNGK